jgi:Uri superfamily endonuclease
MKTKEKTVEKKDVTSIDKGELDRISMKGIYCLLINCRRPQSIQIGRLGIIYFNRGFYLYIGSALNGIGRRVSRHLRVKKNNFWHIDYLLSNRYVNVEQVYCLESDKKIECQIAEKVGRASEPVGGFGSSDCRCRSHLFFLGDRKRGWESFFDIIYNSVFFRQDFKVN